MQLTKIAMGLALALALGGVLPAAAQGQNAPYYGHGEWMWSMAGGFMWIMPLLFLAVLVALIVAAVRLISPRHAGAGGDSGSAALDVLNARYARGEIGRDEYLEKKKDVAGG